MVLTNAISYSLMTNNFMDYAQKPNAHGLNLPCEWQTHTWMMTWNLYSYNNNLLLLLDNGCPLW